jgi:hypothetical protein
MEKKLVLEEYENATKPQTTHGLKIYRQPLVVAFIYGCIAGLIVSCFMIYFEEEIWGTQYE